MLALVSEPSVPWEGCSWQWRYINDSAQKKHIHTRAELVPGNMYIKSTALVSVNQDWSKCTHLESILHPPTEVRVVEIVRRYDLRRVRGRIDQPEGWISLENLDTNFRWVGTEHCFLTPNPPNQQRSFVTPVEDSVEEGSMEGTPRRHRRSVRHFVRLVEQTTIDTRTLDVYRLTCSLISKGHRYRGKDLTESGFLTDSMQPGMRPASSGMGSNLMCTGDCPRLPSGLRAQSSGGIRAQSSGGIRPVGRPPLPGEREELQRGDQCHEDLTHAPAIWVAVKHGNPHLIPRLAAAGCSPDAFGPDGNTPLMVAAATNDVEALRRLLSTNSKEQIISVTAR